MKGAGIALAIVAGVVVVGGVLYFMMRRAPSSGAASSSGFDLSGMLSRVSGGAVTGTAGAATRKGPATFASQPPADATFSLEEAGIA